MKTRHWILATLGVTLVVGGLALFFFSKAVSQQNAALPQTLEEKLQRREKARARILELEKRTDDAFFELVNALNKNVSGEEIKESLLSYLIAEIVAAKEARRLSNEILASGPSFEIDELDSTQFSAYRQRMDPILKTLRDCRDKSFSLDERRVVEQALNRLTTLSPPQGGFRTAKI